MIGVVLAAGAGRRLRPDTDFLPKTLLPISDGRTILDVALANMATVGITEVVVVVGHAADVIRERVSDLEQRHGVTLKLVENDRAEDWNNAYSLWLARDYFAEGALLVNGDTVHPPSVEKALLTKRGAGVLLAIDNVKPLADEEMKVTFNSQGRLVRIQKSIDPSLADGEYIGACLIERIAAADLASALADTWGRDPQLYYEDGIEEFAVRGGEVRGASIGKIDWVEVDNHADLARAREIACLY